MDKDYILKKVIAKVKSNVVVENDFIDEYTCLCNYWTPSSKYILETGLFEKLDKPACCKGVSEITHVKSPYGYNVIHINDREFYVMDSGNSLINYEGKITFEILGSEERQNKYYDKCLVDGYGGRIIIYLSEAKKI